MSSQSNAIVCNRADHAALAERAIAAERRALEAEETLRELECEDFQCSHHLVAIWRARAVAAADDRNRLAARVNRGGAA